MALVNTRRTTKLIEGGHHRGFQAYRPICYYFYPFFTFFQHPKNVTCCVFGIVSCFAKQCFRLVQTFEHVMMPWKFHV